MTAYIFDTELTDFDGEIIEAAWLRLGEAADLVGDHGYIRTDVAAEWAQRYKPTAPISFGAMSVHHILPQDLRDCPPSSTFRLPLDCAYLIGHSIDEDWKAAGSPAHVKRICTHAIARWEWTEHRGYSQSALVYLNEGPTPATRELVQAAHSAPADVRLNHLLLHHILKRHPEIQTWEQLWQHSEKCRIPRTCPLARWKDVLLTDMDYDAIDWCLRQHWISEYFRKGLEQVLETRRAEYGGARSFDEEDHVDE